MKRNTGKIQYFIVSMLFFGLAGVLLYFDDKVKYEPLSFAFGFIAQIIMLELVIVWMVSVNSRIVQNNIYLHGLRRKKDGKNTEVGAYRKDDIGK